MDAAIEPLETTCQHKNTNPCCRIIEVKYEYVIDESSCLFEWNYVFIDTARHGLKEDNELGMDQRFYSVGICEDDCDKTG